MGQPDSYGNQSTCVVEYAVLWLNGTWTTETHDIPIDLHEDDTAANEWAEENLMPYVVTYKRGGKEAFSTAEKILVYEWP